VKAITNEETREKLSEQLKRAVCIELAFWSSCFVVEALLENKCDAITRIFEVGRHYAKQRIRDSDVEEIMFGVDAENLGAATGGRKEVRVLAQLPRDSKRNLLGATQNAIWLHNALLDEAESIAEVIECEPETVLNLLSDLTAEIDLGFEIPEGYLAWFFGEVHTDSETSVVQGFIEPEESGSTESSPVDEGRKI